MTAMALQDAAGRRRSPATLPDFHAGRPPRNKGLRYPADPPSVEEIVAVMRQAGTTTQGLRMRALIVVLWRAGLRIGEALALTETDLDERRGSVLVRHGKGDKRREVAWTTGAGSSCTRGSGGASLCPWARCCASPADPPQAGPVGGLGRPRPAAAPCRSGGRAPTLRAASAASRSRRRDGSRGRVAERHPAAARPRQPRHHLGLPRRHRQRRDHRRRPRAAPAHAAGHRRPADLNNARRRVPARRHRTAPRPEEQRRSPPRGAAESRPKQKRKLRAGWTMDEQLLSSRSAFVVAARGAPRPRSRRA
jgi:hypothetical protein